MIDLDKRTVKILRYIHKKNKDGVSWEKLHKKYSKHGLNLFLLEALNKEQYLVTKNTQDEWIEFDNTQINMDSRYVSYTTTKSAEVIEESNKEYFKLLITIVGTILIPLLLLLL